MESLCKATVSNFGLRLTWNFLEQPVHNTAVSNFRTFISDPVGWYYNKWIILNTTSGKHTRSFVQLLQNSSFLTLEKGIPTLEKVEHAQFYSMSYFEGPNLLLLQWGVTVNSWNLVVKKPRLSLEVWCLVKALVYQCQWVITEIVYCKYETILPSKHLLFIFNLFLRQRLR